MEPVAYINGSFLPVSRALISPLDTGYLYGHGVFETLRGYEGRIFALNEHIERLKRGCERIHIDLSTDTDKLKSIIYELIKRNLLSQENSYIRITITGGVTHQHITDKTEPTLFILCRPLEEDVLKKAEKGIRATIIKEDRGTTLSNHKTTSYLPMYIGRIDAKRKGFDEGIFVNQRGELTEGCTTNIFIYRGERLLTPPLDAGILPGITREHVKNLPQRWG